MKRRICRFHGKCYGEKLVLNIRNGTVICAAVCRWFASNIENRKTISIGPFTVVRACWVIRTRWWGSQKFVWEFKINSKVN